MFSFFFIQDWLSLSNTILCLPWRRLLCWLSLFGLVCACRAQSKGLLLCFSVSILIYLGLLLLASFAYNWSSCTCCHRISYTQIIEASSNTLHRFFMWLECVSECIDTKLTIRCIQIDGCLSIFVEKLLNKFLYIVMLKDSILLILRLI